MIVAIVAEKYTGNLLKAIQSVQDDVDILELRLDFLIEIEKIELKKVIAKINKPYILTLRPVNQGGLFKGSESQRLAILYEFAELEPTYIDVECSVDDSFINKLHQSYPSINIIRSYHNFSETPENLSEILLSMFHSYVSAYKVVTYAKTTIDNLRVLHFVTKHAQNIKLVAHCMGSLGLPSRVIGAALGNYFTYASLPEREVPLPYCPDVRTLIDIYSLKKLNKKTKIFALLGDPVEHSVGHLFHNQKFTELRENAVYLKIKLNEYELVDFLKYIKGLPFHGFSVTMPLKEKILPYINVPDINCQMIGAANTISIKGGQSYAINTDGVGALDAIESQCLIEGCHVLIIGAGGAAKAIAHECHLRKPLSLTVVNRTLSTAQTLAGKVNGIAYDINSFEPRKMEPYNIIINTIPNTEQNDAAVLKIINPCLSNQSVFMNIDYSKKTSLLLMKIKEAGCIMLDPSSMFINQALRQIDYWFQR